MQGRRYRGGEAAARGGRRRTGGWVVQVVSADWRNCNRTWAIADSVFIATPGFSESGIQLASATGKPLGFLWIHVRGFIKWAKQNLGSEFFSSLRGLPT